MWFSKHFTARLFILGVALGIGFGFSWKLTLVTLGFIPFLIVGGLIEMQLIVGAEIEENNTYDEAGKNKLEANDSC